MPDPDFPQAFDAMLFDMDGTILTSIKAAERVWAAWAIGHGLDPETFLPTIHGIQAIETIRRLGLPGVDPEVEAAAITRAEIADTEGIEPIAGADILLAALPPNRWAWSRPRPCAGVRRIGAAGLPVPPPVTAEDGSGASRRRTGSCSRPSASAPRGLSPRSSAAGVEAAEVPRISRVVTATHRHPLPTRLAPADYAQLRFLDDQQSGVLAERRPP